MQVFLPQPNLHSIKYLDTKRLGNQVYREGLTLLRGGWPNHPVSKMWKDYKPALALYCLYGLEELYTRGRDHLKWMHEFVNYIQTPATILHTTKVELSSFINFVNIEIDLPPFVCDKLCSSHRAALLYKGMCDETFKKYRGKELLPLRKKDWKTLDYEKAWYLFGKPKGYYHQFNWTEVPKIDYWWPNV